MPMISKLFINLLIVSASLDCTNLNRTIESDQNESLLLNKNENTTEEQPQNYCTKRNKIEGNSSTGSSQTSSSTVCNLTNENIEKQLNGPFKNLLMETLNVLDRIFYIYEGKYIDIIQCSEMEIQQIVAQTDWFVNYLEQSKNIVPMRNLYLESTFARYLISFKHLNSVEQNVIDQYYIQLYYELKDANIQTLFNTLLFAVKESGPTGPTGVVICVLLMLSTLKTDNISKYHRDYLIYLIVAHKCIVSEKSKTDSDSKITTIQKIKKKIYKKMCMILFPETYRVKCEQIYNLTENVYLKNYWFNEFSVILLMQYINGMHMIELDFILRSLNNFKTNGINGMHDSVSEYYENMYNLFYIENILLDKAKSAFVSCFCH